ncbi:MAG: DUF4845 domain-containing protein [Moraxellaceae bacterium]|nr:DUF4845 domain-containing protein [Moraxellaceae bacterium]
MQSRHKQSGMSYAGVFFLLLLAASMIKVVAAIGPAYYDFYTIDKIISSLYRDGRTNSVEVFKKGMSERFSINQISGRSPDDFSYSMDGGSLIVFLDYEERKNMIANVDIIVHFEKTYGSDEATQ